MKGHKKVVKKEILGDDHVFMYKELRLVERPDALPANRPNYMLLQDMGLKLFSH